MRDELIRIDKNGTKYFADYTCTRCGGAGGSDKWALTGWTCYECGGSGKRVTPMVYKEYTEEYRAKLDARKAKRDAEKLAKRIEEFNTNLMGLVQKYGFNSDGNIYVVTGNTYIIKDQLKEAGAQFNYNVHWYFLEEQDTFPTVKLNYTECLDVYPEYGTVSWKDGYLVEEAISSKLPKEEELPSEYVGEIGQKLESEVTFVDRFTYEVRSFKGYGTDTIAVNQFRDTNGNILVWKSSSAFFDAMQGDKMILKGTVKEHSEYKDVKQTLLQRCKLTAI